MHNNRSALSKQHRVQCYAATNDAFDIFQYAHLSLTARPVGSFVSLQSRTAIPPDGDAVYVSRASPET